uniref:TROVE domain-containing protein n=1 Tax=Kryptolebias marmoratus TaxID=37003 RepID=A0A3Q3B4J1_KRYMA
MRALTLRQTQPGEQQHQPPSCGRSLTSNFSPPSLENKFLSGTSTTKPRSSLVNAAAQPSSMSSLQPSTLSSTSSSLLSTSSSFLSTQNKLLAAEPPRLSFSWTSPVPGSSLLSTALPGASLHNRFAQPPSFLRPDPSGSARLALAALSASSAGCSRGARRSCCTSLFLIQVAVYTRQELNIRITANFLLALAASLPPAKPHVRRYFCAAVQLPSDWLEVVRIYSSLGFLNPGLLPFLSPAKAMADKFKDFSEYQLAKYNTRKHRCKHRRRTPKANVWMCSLSLQTEGDRAVVDKKQSEFSIKKLIQKLHIKEPAELVMAILGRKYPSDAKEFNRSGIKGAWDRERAGQRMKLKEPQTWDRLLSMEGNKAATWEKLIDSKSLPFMAMLRNLRNMITRGISEAHHKKILSRLTNQVRPTRLLIFWFVNHKYAAGLLNLKWEATQKKRVKIQRLYTIELLDRYRRALETAVQIACRYNVPPLPGKTVILLSCNMEGDESWSKKQDFCLPVEPKQEEEEEDKDEEEEAAGSRRKRRTLEDDHDPLTPTRGSSRLLDHVEHLDKMYNIPPDGAKEPQTSDKRVSVWRGVRVFISSTFRDMHAERDVLVRSVFPELRRRAAAHRLHLQEVELRWGVTEEESERAAELCLSEVCRSQMLVGILGERYGQVPPRPVLPDLPQYSWLASAPAGLSITEMEIRQFQALYPDMAFCWFRSIPAAWRSDFAAESKEAEDKLRSLKKRLLDCKVKVTENYLCEWGGVVEGKPYLKNLEEFGKAVLEDLWTAVQNQFVEVSKSDELSQKCPEEAERRRRRRITSSSLVQVGDDRVMRSLKEQRFPDVCLILFIYFPNRDLLAELHSTLRETKKPLVVLVDGVDLLQDGGGRLSSDWIPQLLPQGVCLMLSMGTGAALLKPLTVKRGAVLFSLAPLAIPDRKEIVRKELDVFGKKLSDSAFNNQVPLQTLSASPLYLHLACEDLRSFASFDKVQNDLF